MGIPSSQQIQSTSASPNLYSASGMLHNSFTGMEPGPFVYHHASAGSGYCTHQQMTANQHQLSNATSPALTQLSQPSRLAFFSSIKL